MPFEIELSFSYSSFFQGILIGLLASVLFALVPLLQIRKVSPLNVLRSLGWGKTSKASRFVYVLVVLFVFGFSYIQLDELQKAAVFTVSLLGAALILMGVSRLIIWAVRKYFPEKAPFTTRQGLANLYRPNNQTLILVVTIGLGTALITTLMLSQDLLLDKVKLSSSENQPNMVLFDIQSDQVDQVIEITKNDSLPVIQEVPIVTMKLHSLKGESVDAIREDTTAGVRNWVLRREYRVTYRDSLIASKSVSEAIKLSR